MVKDVDELDDPGSEDSGTISDVIDSSESSDTDSDEIRESDIIFECPHCTKSLAIDYRGAGLTILCSDCGQSVQVPIPDGMELSDLDVSEAEQERIILHLRKALTEAHEKIESLMSDNADIARRRDILDKMHTRDLSKIESIQRELDSMKRAVESLDAAIKTISENLRKNN
jgi:transcription elongation factor Elf1